MSLRVCPIKKKGTWNNKGTSIPFTKFITAVKSCSTQDFGLFALCTFSEESNIYEKDCNKRSVGTIFQGYAMLLASSITIALTYSISCEYFIMSIVSLLLSQHNARPWKAYQKQKTWHQWPRKGTFYDTHAEGQSLENCQQSCSIVKEYCIYYGWDKLRKECNHYKSAAVRGQWYKTFS